MPSALPSRGRARGVAWWQTRLPQRAASATTVEHAVERVPPARRRRRREQPGNMQHPRNILPPSPCPLSHLHTILRPLAPPFPSPRYRHGRRSVPVTATASAKPFAGGRWLHGGRICLSGRRVRRPTSAGAVGATSSSAAAAQAWEHPSPRAPPLPPARPPPLPLPRLLPLTRPLPVAGGGADGVIQFVRTRLVVILKYSTYLYTRV